eukprot:5521240-Prymnesium_polylepis.1
MIGMMRLETEVATALRRTPEQAAALFCAGERRAGERGVRNVPQLAIQYVSASPVARMVTVSTHH